MYFFKIKIVHFITVIIILQLSCDPANQKKLPPPLIVQMVPKYSDLSAYERGVDADANSNGIFLEWYLLQDPDLKSYNIYRKLDSDNFFPELPLISIQVEGVISVFDTVYSYIDEESVVLDNSNFVYNYIIRAENKDGVEGANSDTAKYMLFSKPLTKDIQNFSMGEMPVFEWSFQFDPAPNYYIIRIEDQFADTLVWVRKFLNVGLQRDVVKDLATVSNPPEFNQGSFYRWRIDAVGTDSLYSGSESNWRTFSVN